MRFTILINALLLVVFCKTINASTITVGGAITTNTIWSTDTVVLISEVKVMDGITLTINQGAVILSPKFDLVISGRIIALGTPAKPILFMPTPTSLGFGQIRFDSVGTFNDTSIFAHCKFEKLTNISSKKWDKLQVINCNFSNSQESSIYLDSSSAIIKNNVFYLSYYLSQGGAIVVFNGSRARIENNLFDSCGTRYSGTAVSCSLSTFSLINNIFRRCYNQSPSTPSSSVVAVTLPDSNILIDGNVWENSHRIGSFTILVLTEAQGIVKNNIFKNVVNEAFSATKCTLSLERNVIDSSLTGMTLIRCQTTSFQNTIKNCDISGMVMQSGGTLRSIEDTFIGNRSALVVTPVTGLASFDSAFVIGGFFSKNGKTTSGAALRIKEGVVGLVRNCTFENNSGVKGGAIYAEAYEGILGFRPVLITNNYFYGNSAEEGGALYLKFHVYLENNIIDSNFATDFGGGIYTRSFRILKNQITRNKAEYGGGVYTEEGSEAQFRLNRITHNEAFKDGGGIYCNFPDVRPIENCLIANNKAGRNGGGFYLPEVTFSGHPGEYFFRHCGFYFNEADTGGGIYTYVKDSVYFESTCFWGNRAKAGDQVYFDNPDFDPIFRYSNVEGGQSGLASPDSSYSGQWFQTTALDPLFVQAPAQPGYNSGFNADFSLQDHSPLINKGDPLAAPFDPFVDILGHRRVDGDTVDIGPLEWGYPATILNLSLDSTTCIGGTATFIVKTYGQENKYTWYKDGSPIPGIDNDTLELLNLSFVDSGNYHVVVGNAKGADTSQMVTLKVHANPPAFTIGNDTTFCSGDSIVLYAPAGYSSYQWNKPSNTNSIVAKLSGKYFVKVTDHNGCSGYSDTLTITTIISPSKPKVNEVAYNELQSSIFSVTYGYKWFLNDSLLPDSNRRITVNQTGWYRVLLTKGICFSDTSDPYYYQFPPADSVWPGDANYDGVVNNIDILAIGVKYGSVGIPRSSVTTSWQPYFCGNWPDTLSNGVNTKHVDANGDGFILSSDAAVVALNYGKMHNKKGADKRGGPGDPVLKVKILEDTLKTGTEMTAEIMLGDQQYLAEDIYGLAFTLKLTEEWIDPGSLSFDYTTSWLGNANYHFVQVAKIFNDATIETAVSRNDKSNRSGEGTIATLTFRTRDTLISTLPNVLKVELSDVYVINANEESKAVNIESDSLIAMIPNGLRRADLSATIHVFPNPAKGKIYIHHSVDIHKIELISLDNKLVLAKNINTTSYKNPEQIEFSLSSLCPGVYLLRLVTTEGVINKKVVVTD